MEGRKIYNLASDFKQAILKAKDAGLFSGDIVFNRFPRGCCGDTCELLAEFLYSKEIDTIYVCGDDNGQTHAWLVVKDCRVKVPKQRFYEVPNEVRNVLNSYGNDVCNGVIDSTHYEENDLIDGLIIDITADQFGESSVFVGKLNEFYKKFEFVNAHDCERLIGGRMASIYRKIMRYIS